MTTTLVYLVCYQLMQQSVSEFSEPPIVGLPSDLSGDVVPTRIRAVLRLSFVGSTGRGAANFHTGRMWSGARHIDNNIDISAHLDKWQRMRIVRPHQIEIPESPFTAWPLSSSFSRF